MGLHLIMDYYKVIKLSESFFLLLAVKQPVFWGVGSVGTQNDLASRHMIHSARFHRDAKGEMGVSFMVAAVHFVEHVILSPRVESNNHSHQVEVAVQALLCQKSTAY